MTSPISPDILKYFSGSENAYYEEKAKYIENLCYDSHKSIVNYQTSITNTINTTSSISRSTACDVISLSTTVWISPHGTTTKAERFNLLSRGSRRVPQSAPAVSNKTRLSKLLPTQTALYKDEKKSRHLISDMLIAERDKFLEKLNIISENKMIILREAAVVIQKYYRRRYFMFHYDDIKAEQAIMKVKRAEYVKYMRETEGIDVTLGYYRRTYKQRRISAVIKIQSIYRSFLAKLYYDHLRRAMERRRYHESVIKIQSLCRKKAAMDRLHIIHMRQRLASTITAVIKLQAYTRKFVTTKTLSRNIIYIRAKSILFLQKWVKKCIQRVRARKARKSRVEAMMHHRLITIQRYIRIFLAKRRILRMKIRRLYDIMFVAARKIQAWVRLIIAPILLHKDQVKTHLSTFMQQHSMHHFGLSPPISPACVDDIDTRNSAGMFEQRQDSLVKTESNIFTLAARGTIDELEAIFQNQSVLLSSTPSSEPLLSKPSSTTQHHAYETNDAGDTILTIAASQGHIDIVRQCLRWGFDPNHRNKSNHNALYLSVKHNHIQVMQYLLSLNKVTSITPIKQLDILTDHDMAELLIVAVENSMTKGLGALTFLLSHGLAVDAVTNGTGLTAYLVAVSCNNIDAVKLILQYEPNADHRDCKRQSLLHKACMSSFELVKVFLGEEEEMDQIYGSINTATGEDIVVHIFPDQAMKLKDLEGKDCSAIAAIYGQTDILDYLCKRTPDLISSQVSPSHANVTLSYDDTQAIFKLAETNNVICMTYVIQNLRYDANSKDPATDMTIMMKAASCGSTDVLECLISTLAFQLDLSSCDIEGWNILHHAALCPDVGMMTYILRHRMISCCNIDDSMLSCVNNTKDTPLHIAIDTAAAVTMNNADGIRTPAYSRPTSPLFSARVNQSHENIALKSLLSLLCDEYPGARDAMEMKNSDGLTLLQHACKLGQHEIITKLLELGADATVMDKKGNTCLWLFLHSEHVPDILRSNITAALGNQSGMKKVTHNSMIPTSRTASLTTRTRNAGRRTSINLARDVAVVMALFRADCQLYKFNKVTPERILAACAGPGRLQLDSGDVIAQEKCYELLRCLPPLLSYIDCWRLVLSCIRFALPTIITPGSPLYANIGVEDEDVALCRPLLTIIESVQSVDVLWSQNTSLIPYDGVINHQQKISYALSADIIHKLQYAMFGGITILGWAVKLNNHHVLTVLEREGLSLAAPIDVKGNTLLHIIAESSSISYSVSKSIIDVILCHNIQLLQAKNKEGMTAGMLCARHGSTHVFKLLYEYGCNPRPSLRVKYSAWILAYVRRYEQLEKERGVWDAMNFLEYTCDNL